MNPPMDEIDLTPEKLEEEKEAGPMFHCDLSDTDIVHKLALAFLPGLAAACIDNTTGGLLKTPASVAVDIRREMVDYLIQRSENFVAESVVLEGGPGAELSDNPYDIISDFIDDFASSKRNFFSRVSGWALSEKREDWIDDFVQEMEINGFWLLNRRNAVAQTLLKNVDIKNLYHCSSSFKAQEDLEEHKLRCSFRTMACTNEGCNSRFSAAQMEFHDSQCPFKILPCEQNCSDRIMRRVMDRHCITTCPMKLVKCPFYSIGCVSNVPQSMIDQHKAEELPSHLLYILQGFYKEASVEDLKERREEIEKLSSPGRLASARDGRSLTIMLKDLDAKLGPMKIKTNPKPVEEHIDLVNEKEKTDLPIKGVEPDKSLSKKEDSVKSLSEDNSKDNSSQRTDLVNEKEKTNLPIKEAKPEKLLSKKEESIKSISEVNSQDNSSHGKVELEVASVPLQENSNKSALQTEEGPYSAEKVEVQMEKSLKEEAEHSIEVHSKSPTKQEEHGELIDKTEKHVESIDKTEKHAETIDKTEKHAETIDKMEKHAGTIDKTEKHHELTV